MRGIRTVTLALTLVLLLSGCGRFGQNEYTVDVPEPPKVDAAAKSAEPEKSAQPPATPVPSAEAVADAQAEATPPGDAAVNEADTARNDAAIDALIEELDAMGKMLDSLDTPSDADLVYPES